MSSGVALARTLVPVVQAISQHMITVTVLMFAIPDHDNYEDDCGDNNDN